MTDTVNTYKYSDLSSYNTDNASTKNAASNSKSSATTNSNSTLGKDAFLQLLVTQMKYQDPLEPTSNTEYVAQLATFSQVEELQNVAASISQTQANGLIGKIVVMKTETATGSAAFIGGKVERVVMQNGKVYLGVNGGLYDIDNLDSVVEEEFYDKYYQGGLGGSGSTGGTDGSTDDKEETEDDKTETE